MANLLVEIGNTALKAAWSEGLTIGKTYRYQGEKFVKFILSLTSREKPQVMAVSSVFPISAEDEKILKAECLHLMLMDPEHESIIQRFAIPEHLSYDRAASVIAARRLFKNKACSIFDFGTTLTVDFIESDGRYRGGYISPGCRTRFKSLQRYTRTLPQVDTPVKEPSEGTDIKTSIETGVISGMIFEAEGIIASHPGNIVIFTGGDAIYFSKRMKDSIFVICNLTLMGMAIITDDYVRKNLQ